MSYRRGLAPLLSVLCVLGSVAVASKADASARPLSGVVRAKADENSLNWAGYYVPAQPGERITEVTGYTYAPGLKVLPPTLAASWIGIGGARTSDLIQAGVAFSQVEGYYAWFERLPEPMRPITRGCVGDSRCRVTKGDRIDMHIKHLGGDMWRVSLANAGKWSWSMDTPYDSSFSSAEWIYEAPSYLGVYTVPAKVPHAQFFANGYRVNGVAKSLRAADGVRTHFAPVGFPRISTPSPVRADSAFKVCAYQQDCPVPGK